MSINDIAVNFNVNSELLREIVLQNEIPHETEHGQLFINDDSIEFVMELYYQKYGENAGRRYYPSQENRYCTPAQPKVPGQNPYSYSDNMLPEKYRPISSWGYVGYNILFAIPLIGFLLLIVFSLDNSNINRRNYARSSWCTLLLIIVIFAIVGYLSASTGYDILTPFSKGFFG